MTIEKAINHIKYGLIENNYPLPKELGIEVLQMAIEALKMVDDFERAQIITGGRLNGRTYAYKCGLEDGKRKVLEQEPCEDSISRKAVFETIDDCNSDGLKGIFCSYVDGEKFKKYIKELPSVISKGVTVTDFADKCSECGKQKKTKWIIKTHGFPPEPTTVCLKCGFDRDFYIRTIGFDKIKFCPNCGRKIEVEE